MNEVLTLLKGLNLYDSYSQVAALALGVIFLIALVFRIAMYLRFKADAGAYVRFRKHTKLAAREDIEAVRKKKGFFPFIIDQFISFAERGVRCDAKSIVTRRVNTYSVFFWKCASVERFIESVESVMPFAVIAAALALENKAELMLLGLALIIVQRLSLLMLDFKPVRDYFIDESSAFVEFNAGRFFALDMSSSINMLRADMSAAITASVNAVQAAIKTSFSAVEDFDVKAREQIALWNEAVSRAAEAQHGVNSAVEAELAALNKTLDANKTISESFDRFAIKIEGLTNELQMGVRELTEAGKSSRLRDDLFEEQIKQVQANQRTLESGIVEFEQLLNGINKELAETFSRVVDYHAKESFALARSELQDNIKQIFASNNELILRMQDLFDQVREQNRAETVALLNLKEQIEMQFDLLSADRESNG